MSFVSLSWSSLPLLSLSQSSMLSLLSSMLSSSLSSMSWDHRSPISNLWRHLWTQKCFKLSGCLAGIAINFAALDGSLGFESSPRNLNDHFATKDVLLIHLLCRGSVYLVTERRWVRFLLQPVIPIVTTLTYLIKNEKLSLAELQGTKRLVCAWTWLHGLVGQVHPNLAQLRKWPVTSRKGLLITGITRYEWISWQDWQWVVTLVVVSPQTLLFLPLVKKSRINILPFF